MSSVDSGTTTPVMCANHPKVETGVSCSECGKPICPDCMVPAAVGIKCRECARLPRSARAAMKPDRLVRAVGASLAAGIAMGVVLAFAGGVGLGFFTFVVGYGVGLLAARATVWGAGYRSGSVTGWIAAGGATAAYVIAAAVISAEVGGGIRLYIQVLGLAIAAFVAFREAS